MASKINKFSCMQYVHHIKYNLVKYPLSKSYTVKQYKKYLLFMDYFGLIITQIIIVCLQQ